MKIFGAGLAGLLAAQAFPKAEILEASSKDRVGHKALLRFRTTAVGHLTGVPFKKVKVNKGIWSEGADAKISVRLANMYSRKVSCGYSDRSIWKLEPVERFVSPPNFLEELTESLSSRIHWNFVINDQNISDLTNSAAISTLPMPLLVRLFKNELPPNLIMREPAFSCWKIAVRRYKIKDANIHQTMYYPDLTTRLYRASIVGDTMIAEFVECPDEMGYHNLLKSFGLFHGDLTFEGEYNQSNGKIAEIDSIFRKEFIYWLTEAKRIYSLGRFATWRGIVLDDVVDDIDVIKRLLSSLNYDKSKFFAK